MHKWLLLLGLVGFGLLAWQPTHAQFAGCAEDDEMPYAARFIIQDIYDSKLLLTVVGVGDFDPQIEIRRADTGRYVDCNNDSPQAISKGVNLPTASGGFKTNSAQADIRFYADEQPNDNPADFEVIITEADGRSGEFVLIYEGAAIWDATDVDTFTVITTEEQVAQGMPLAIYAVNPTRDTVNLDPQLDFILASGFRLTCQYSTLSDLCAPNTIPLEGFDITLDMMEALPLSGYDVMINYPPDTPNAEYQVEVRAIDQLTWGDYVLLIHGGVAYPAE